MKLQRQFNRRVKGKEYGKWLVVIPPATIEELGWREGDELQARVEENGLKLFRKRQGR